MFSLMVNRRELYELSERLLAAIFSPSQEAAPLRRTVNAFKARRQTVKGLTWRSAGRVLEVAVGIEGAKARLNEMPE